ncbi:peptidoglycan-binding protein [Amphibacillus sediminis]|uniref:peptidoglycan-binding protein n=1 Tax=Amphibacillus sediminis TaxID=360185 RepID=UPI00082ED721|nr:peptidoglycan-binding protein [Amphibacillus sediminis]
MIKKNRIALVWVILLFLLFNGNNVIYGEDGTREDGTLYPNDNNFEVALLKEHLNELGFSVGMDYPNNYGPSTKRAVEQLQAYYGLNVTGIVDSLTSQTIDEIINNPLRLGQNNIETQQLKEKLSQLGFSVTMISSDSYDEETEQIIKDLQAQFDLVVNGIGDPITLALVDEILESQKEELNTELTSKNLTNLTEKTTHELGPKSNNEQVAELKANLNLVGFSVGMNYPNNYGPATERAVKEFQAYYGLSATGIADSQTLQKLDEILTSPLRRGQNNDQARELKENLNRIGFTVSMNSPGSYGPATEQALKDFQSHYGLVVNGIGDSVTLAKLEEVLNQDLSVGITRPDVVMFKEKLGMIGFPVASNPTPYYGKTTERVVKEFQAYYGLPVTGIADSETLSVLENAVNQRLGPGSNNNRVAELKENLNLVGFSVGMNYPKSYGPATERAVDRFQSYYGLRVTGIADSQTQEKLDEILTSPLRRGQNNDQARELKENLNRIGFTVSMNSPGSYGPATEQAVRDFQSHYGLVVNGIGDSVTLDQINTILNSPYQNGKSHPDMVIFKRMLNTLGYNGLSTSNDIFGNNTERRVREFQEAMGLPVSGILDEISIEVLYQVYEKRAVYQETKYNVTLNQQLSIQMGLSTPPQTDLFKNAPAYVRTSDLSFSTSGVITGSGVRVRTSPSTTNNDNIDSVLSNGTAVEYVKTVKGSSVSGNTDWYEIRYNGKTLYVHSSLASKSAATARTTRSTKVYESQSTSSHVYYTLSGNKSVSVVNQGSTWTQITGEVWRNAKPDQVLQYLDPAKQDEFQHLLLSSSVNVPSAQINRILSGKGILNGKGQAFIDAAKTHNVNEVYLISHALLETGHGNSSLANGIEVGRNSSGNLVLVNSSNRKDLRDIKKVYNMFGIGASDGDAERLGAIRAYNEGWDTPAKAIIGGAKFIGESYIHNRYQQNTLYKMRWNPANPGYPQYATDMGWAAKQVSTIKSMYQQLDNPMMTFDIVKYR